MHFYIKQGKLFSVNGIASRLGGSGRPKSGPGSTVKLYIHLGCSIYAIANRPIHFAKKAILVHFI